MPGFGKPAATPSRQQWRGAHDGTLVSGAGLVPGRAAPDEVRRRIAEHPLPGARTATWLGALFESLVTQSIRVYAEAAGARIGHLRTKNTEHEIDLIVEGDDHQVVAIEVKLASTVEAADVRHLNWLHGAIGERLAARVVVYSGSYSYRRPDGVFVVPLALVGP